MVEPATSTQQENSSFYAPSAPPVPGRTLVAAGLACFAVAALLFLWAINVSTVTTAELPAGEFTAALAIPQADYAGLARRALLTNLWQTLSIVGAILVGSGSIVRAVAKP